MKRPQSSDVAAGCLRCPAYPGPLGAQASVQKVTRIPTQRVRPTTGDAQDVVLAISGQGTFRIRRRPNRLTQACPLRHYEVTRIDPADPADRKRSRATAGSPVGPSKTQEPCRELLLLFLRGML